MNEFTIEPIGLIRSPFPEKFGIPRQPRMVVNLSEIHLFSPFNREEFVKDLEQFSHIWIHFVFHDSIKEEWRPTVRPPGLGGQQRVGVFASRSPHRPNHLGFSAVKLMDINRSKSGVILEVQGGDFLDKTPVIDIKPYVPFSDSIDEATDGFSGVTTKGIDVKFTEETTLFCQDYFTKTGRDIHSLILESLMIDPRPASQRKRRKHFGIRLYNINVRWLADGNSFTVMECTLEEF